MPPPSGAGLRVEAGHDVGAALHQSELKRQALLSTISELVFVVSKHGGVLEFHAPPDRAFSLSAGGLVGRSLKELLPHQIGLQAMHYVEKACRTGQVQVATAQFQGRNGVRHFEVRLAPYDTDQVIALVRDVSDRTFLEKEMAEISHREQMRIGQDLHDGLGQHLTGITFLAKALQRKLAAQSLPEAEEAEEISRLVMQALSQTRSLARGLFPVELESNGLVAAFHELAQRIRQTCSVACVFEHDEAVTLEHRATSLHLFRLAQEAISNAVRHGKAKTIAIRLERQGAQTVLTVADDGGGMPVEDRRPQGLGLRIMAYRAQKIGGTLQILPRPSGGTVVRCAFTEPPPQPETLS
ncbi:MAG: PAS domain-containing protein [Verrucomicrobia bacterium]|nr:PAS domain-containing protein [Verrucomicrobiota bacterium]